MNAPLNPNNWQLIGLTPALGDLSITVGTSLSIGRSDNNDVVLASPQVSRQHAKINRIGDKLYLQDLGSANGTFINGERVGKEATLIQANDELAFADILFTIDNNASPNDDLTDDMIEQITSSQEVSAPVNKAVTDTIATKDTEIKIQPVISDNDAQKTVETYQIDSNKRITTPINTSATVESVTTEQSNVATAEPTPITTDMVKNATAEAPIAEADTTSHLPTHSTEGTKKSLMPIMVIVAVIIVAIIIAVFMR